MSNSNGHRWSKFWWADWRGDSALRMCGLAARGLWMEMLCVAHEATPMGYVMMNGHALSGRQIALIAGCQEREANKLLAELEDNGVFSRTENGTIYCRRMVRDAGRSDVGAAEVRKKWGDEGPESGKSRTSRMTAARRKGTHTPEEWLAMLATIGDQCVRCNKPHSENGGGVVKDHIKPVYQGGSDAIDNIQPLCRRCNASKGPENTDHRPPDWKERLGRCLGQMPRDATRGPPWETTTLYSEAESEAEVPPRRSPANGGPARRADFTNPRALSTSPRETGQNPRAWGNNPRQTDDNPRRKPSKNAFHDLAREFDAEMAQQATTIDGGAEEVADLQAFRARLGGGGRG